jgi:integrase
MNRKPDTDPADEIHLEDPRVVNKRIREENLRAKEDERRMKRGDGQFRKPLKAARQLYPGDPHAQIEYLFQEATVPAAIGRSRFVGDKRLNDYRDIFHYIIRLLREHRAPVQNLSELGKSHVLSAMRAWQKDGLSEGTIQGYLSVMRRFFCLAGKPDMLPKGNRLRDWLHANDLVAGTIGRQQVPELPKGWRDLGISIEDFVETLRAQNEHVVASIVEMAEHWGLRDQEGWFLRPRQSEKDGNGVGLLLRRGTKGDKARLVYYFQEPVRARAQREVLERAKALADKHPRRELSIPGLTAQQMQSHFKWVMRRNGITKKGMGVTPHGLRHQFASDLFRDLTGMPVPVSGLLPAAEYHKQEMLVHRAMQEISEQMGHVRPGISSTYTGSVGKLDKGQIRRIGQTLRRLNPASDLFRLLPVAEAWVVGAYGRGAVTRAGEPMNIVVRPVDPPDQPMTLELLAETVRDLEEALALVAGVPVSVSLWVAAKSPEHAAEILFASRPTVEQQAAVAVPEA